jgi:hypothetical protein
VRRCYLYLFFLFLAEQAIGQPLKPGFDAEEYLAMLRISSGQVDARFRGNTPPEVVLDWAYRSKTMGLHNQWNLWINKSRTTIVINLRGTTSDPDSWLENFYSAMVPAAGSIKIDSDFTFQYKFAADSRAAVHVGWTIGVGALSRDILRKVKQYYGQGIKQIVIEGHSQGGALAFLVTSWLRYQVIDGKLPGDLVIKTYCSAAPKPGNLYYAYDYDFITRGGWAFTVVNTEDWVPETPVTIQTAEDLNPGNPFRRHNALLQNERAVVRWYAGHIYKRLSKTSGKAQATYRKFLGKGAYKMVRKYLPYLERPKYVKSISYAKAGTSIVLQPDSTYRSMYPRDKHDVFRHHVFAPYYYLVQKNYLDTARH